MNLPRISIIIPSYNQGDFLEKAICSVLDQVYPNLELILIDGGSNDQSLEIIQKYAKNLTYWISEPDLGQSQAINKGLAKTSGEIINWLNADDFYEPKALWKVAQFFSPETKVLCGRCRVLDTLTQKQYITQGTDIYPQNLPKTIGCARTDQPATFYHHSAIEKMGLLDEELNFVMDRDWWIRYLLNFGLQGIHRIPDILVNFRLHPTSKTVSQSSMFQLERNRYFYSLARKFELQEMLSLYKNQSMVDGSYQIKYDLSTDKELIRKSLNYYLLLCAEEAYALNHSQETKQMLDLIEKKLLDAEDLRSWQKISFRNTYVPLWLRKGLRYLLKIIRKFKVE